MSFDAQHLYDLLPAIYRIRDTERGEPLKTLLSVIAEQLGVLEENLEQLYNDQFIETCAEWVVPFIGDLIGYRSLHSLPPKLAPKIVSPRAEVAHTIGFRRRKGTMTVLEQLARDVSGLSARPVEFFRLLAWTQYMNHSRLGNFYAPDMRLWEPLERMNTPFDGFARTVEERMKIPFEGVAHTVDVRHIGTEQGLYNIPNIGIFLWPLNSYSLTDSPARSRLQNDRHRYFFSPLGLNTPLYTRAEREDEITHLAEPINAPVPISRRVLDAYLDVYYGKGKSIFLEGVEDVHRIVVCDLSGWKHTPPHGRIGIDPVLGRIFFADAQHQPPLVSFHYGFSADMGGGEYDRADTFDSRLQPVEKIPTPHAAIQDALSIVSSGGVAEISNSGRYEQTPLVNITAAEHLELRAANRHRPTLVLDGDMCITGVAGSEVTVNGLLIAGGAVKVPKIPGNELSRLRLLHCTIVPGSQPNLVVELAGMTLEIDHCIVGGLRAAEEAHVQIADSIIDATSEANTAYADLDDEPTGGTLQIVDTTVVGKVYTSEMKIASNTIFVSHVRSEKKQQGCVRFSFLPLASVVPRRYRCYPASDSDALRVRPQFTSLRYGDPGYAQLTRRSAVEIRTGADDDSEMGAFHKLYHPQRETNVRERVKEYLPFRLEAGVFYVT